MLYLSESSLFESAQHGALFPWSDLFLLGYGRTSFALWMGTASVRIVRPHLLFVSAFQVRRRFGAARRKHAAPSRPTGIAIPKCTGVARHCKCTEPILGRWNRRYLLAAKEDLCSASYRFLCRINRSDCLFNWPGGCMLQFGLDG